MNQKFIYTYNFDKKDIKNWYPIHKYTMFNFFDCTHMQIGSKGQRCLVYKKNQPNLTIYMRKYIHNF